MNETTWDLAHLGHVELLTPKLDKSTRFFTEIMGMSITATVGDSIYLRAYDDYEHHTLKLTASPQAGMRHFAWRARSPQALQRRVEAIQRTPYAIGWNEGDLGHGPAFEFHSPDGHLTEIYFETEKYRCSPQDQSALKNTASRFPGRGINVRRIDHLNLFASDVRAYRDFHLTTLGGIMSESIVDDLENMNPRAVWFMVNSKSYDLAVTLDYLALRGRFHHLTYAVNSREEVLIAADICLENGIQIETGPHKHIIQQTFFLYVYEPGGNRVEIANTTARLITDPDHQTVFWTMEERKRGQAWGLPTIPSFHTQGTPMPTPPS
ncbi:VOC family protein [Spirosoma sp.]|uniref:VOC family protein n=1 Tax=Spirosoma sp. TaxID=1899569 RepID=UPI0026091D5B|nr:VOC family protein [Spirosoma sp.]MCX6218429.1 VOC family protein [Spirosoma sp.]